MFQVVLIVIAIGLASSGMRFFNADLRAIAKKYANGWILFGRCLLAFSVIIIAGNKFAFGDIDITESFGILVLWALVQLFLCAYASGIYKVDRSAGRAGKVMPW